jgi:hypothetical protein
LLHSAEQDAVYNETLHNTTASSVIRSMNWKPIKQENTQVNRFSDIQNPTLSHKRSNAKQLMKSARVSNSGVTTQQQQQQQKFKPIPPPQKSNTIDDDELLNMDIIRQEVKPPTTSRTVATSTSQPSIAKMQASRNSTTTNLFQKFQFIPRN